jgi:isoprenylcysteine carboxyl methyltransferase (ICMT) family protein YpbQ
MAHDHSVSIVFLALFAALQIGRFWVLATLGRRWTIGIIVVRGERLVAQGPYRWLRHPNYAVVIGEIAVVPLALGLPIYALVFSILNAAVLAIRIPAENAVLAAAAGPRP